jgi:hypothetical protein
MRKLNSVLDEILQDAFNTAITVLKEQATGVVVDTLKQALEARLKALLDGEDTATVSTPIPTVQARGKVAAATPVKAEEEEAKEEARPRRRKAKAQASLGEVDIPSIMEGVEVALGKYSTLTTPRGKPLNDVLARRVERVLKYAKALGRSDLAALARSAVATIATNPMAYAMGAWPVLAVALGLPDPIHKVMGE